MINILSLVELVVGNLNDSFLFVSNKTIKYKDNNIIKIKAEIATSNFNIFLYLFSRKNEDVQLYML